MIGARTIAVVVVAVAVAVAGCSAPPASSTRAAPAPLASPAFKSDAHTCADLVVRAEEVWATSLQSDPTTLGGLAYPDQAVTSFWSTALYRVDQSVITASSFVATSFSEDVILMVSRHTAIQKNLETAFFVPAVKSCISAGMSAAGDPITTPYFTPTIPIPSAP